MKKWIALLLACIIALTLPMNVVAETIEYPSIVVTLKGYNNAAEDEAKYREAAAEVIADYYWTYCGYNQDASLYKDLLEEKWMEEIPKGYINGDYKYYYTAAYRKYLFDQNVMKTEYSSARPDDAKKGEEWEKQQKEKYLVLLSDTIAAKVMANPSEWLGESYKFNIHTGELEWDFYTEAINAVGRQEVYQAWSGFIVDMSQTVLSVMVDYYYLPLKKGNESPLTMDDILQATIEGVEDILDEGMDTYFENNINKWKNEMIEFSKVVIRSNLDHADEKIVDYLKNIDKDPEFAEIIAKPDHKKLLLEAIDEILAIYDANDNNTELLIDTWFDENGLSLEDILYGTDLMYVVGLATVKEVWETALKLAKKGFDNCMTDIATGKEKSMSEDAYYNVTGLIDAFFNGLSSAVTESIDDMIKQIKEGGSSVFDDELSTKILNKFAQSMVKDLSGFLAKDFSKKKTTEKEIAGVFSDLISTITEMMSEWQEGYKDASEDERRNFMIKYAHKAGDCVVNHLTNYLSKAIEDAPEKVGKYAKELAPILEKCSINNIKDLIYEPVKSGVEAVRNTKKVLRGEDQDSNSAVNMFNCMETSYSYGSRVQRLLSKLQGVNFKSKDSLKEAIQNDKVISIDDVKLIISYIMTRINTDMIGHGYLMDILIKNENGKKSKFYEYLMEGINSDHIFKHYMQYYKAVETYNSMKEFYDKYQELMRIA